MRLSDENSIQSATGSGLTALKHASIFGIAVNSGSQLLKFGVSFGYQVWIMRLLDPVDFGLVAMAAPVLAFVQLFSDFGLSQAVVQSKTLTQEQSSYLFWFNAGVGTLITVVTMALSPLVGWFYHEPRVTPIVMALGSLLLLGALQAQHFALLNRRMAYSKIATCNIASMVAGCISGIIAARAGIGYWSLVVNQAIASLISLVLIIFFSRWVPSAPRRHADVRKLLGFGGNVMGFNFVNFFSRNLDNVLIGKSWGDASLGLYDRAYKLLLFPITQILSPFAAVALPMLSRTRDTVSSYRRGYLRLLQTILVLTYPGVIFALCESEPLIASIFGQRWAGVAPIFSILGIAALYSPVSNTTGWLFISQDRTKEYRNYGVVSSIAFVASFVIGLPWGPLGVALCYVVVGSVQAPILWWLATKSGPVRFGDLLRALFPICVSGCLSTGVILALKMRGLNFPFELVVLLAVSYATFASGLVLTREGRLWIRDVSTELSLIYRRFQ